MGRLCRLSHWILCHKGALIAGCLFLVAIIGYIDYVTGYERPLLLFYLLPISLAAWFGNLLLGLVVAVIGIVAWMWSDLAAGIPSFQKSGEIVSRCRGPDGYTYEKQVLVSEVSDTEQPLASLTNHRFACDKDYSAHMFGEYW